MSKTYYAIADCKHGIKPQFCLACAKKRIAELEDLLSGSQMLLLRHRFCENCPCAQCHMYRRIREVLK